MKSGLLSWAALLLVFCLVVGSNALVRHTQKEKDAMEARLNHQIEMFDRQDVEGWKSDLHPDAVIEGLTGKYKVPNLKAYFDKIDATRLRSKITAPFSLSDHHAVFARRISGRTRDGCSFKIDNVVTLVKFNEQFQIVGWNDMWTEIESYKECEKTEL